MKWSDLTPNGNTALIWVAASIVLFVAFVIYIVVTGAPS